jgi:acetaldehyde dehydrogenase/alcohol dehydrogenase
MKKFIVGPEICYGEKSINYFNSIKAKRACIVTDGFMVKLGLVDRVTNLLEKNKIGYDIFSEIEPNPSLQTVKKGLNRIIETRPDLLIAIGGGSSIDAAKAIMLLCIKTKEKLVDSESIKKPWFVAIPTTSGTGSEVTSYSVITDTENNIKIPMNDELMIPDVAILDYEFTMTVPPGVTGDTGMDVLTHAIEGYVSNKANDYSDIYAEKAIKNTFNYLLRAYKEGSDKEARRKMHDASCMAGIAFTNSSLGINHSLAHAVGAKFKLSHGKSNAIFLPYVIGYNSGLRSNSIEKVEVAERYTQISKSLGLPSSNVMEGVISLMEAIKVLNREMNIPITIEKAGISKIEFEDSLIDMVDGSLKDICTAGNPIKTNKEDLINLLRLAYRGE